MKEQLIRLSQTIAPAGSEGQIRELLQAAIAPYVDETVVDALGNIIAYKRGKGNDRKQLLLETSMDEPGVIVMHIEENGFARIAPIGEMNAHSLIGERIRFTNNAIGVVGVETSKALKDASFNELFVDLGVKDRNQALEKAPIGISGTVEKSAFTLGEFTVVGKALDNRAACAVVIEAISQLQDLSDDLAIVFSVQKELGSRGVKAAAYRVDPAFAVSIGTAPAGDIPNGPRSELKLGEGPAIKVADGSVIIPPSVRAHLIECANRLEIPYQLEVYRDMKSDAGQILLTRSGVPTAAIDIPIRYQHTPSEMCHLDDLRQAVQLTVEVLRTYDHQKA